MESHGEKKSNNLPEKFEYFLVAYELEQEKNENPILSKTFDIFLGKPSSAKFCETKFTVGNDKIFVIFQQYFPITFFNKIRVLEQLWKNVNRRNWRNPEKRYFIFGKFAFLEGTP